MNHRFLIYKGADICYNILNYFAEQLGQAFEHLGCDVLYYDVEKEGLPGLAQFVGQQFTAVIGFQTYAFDPYLESRRCFLHDLIGGLKFNFQFDHPIWMRAHYEKVPKDYYILTHDRNYTEFIRKYYPNVKDALLLPPGGTLSDVFEGIPQKTKGLVFVGTYTDYRQYYPLIKGSSKEMRYLANAYLLEMKRNPNQTAENALYSMLADRGYSLSDGEFLACMDSLKPMIYCIMSYYREKTIRFLLEAGIDLTVYGSSWKSSPFASSRHLVIRPEITPAEGIKELAGAKASLNIMAWHKDGFTERIANSMLQRSVVISDRSTCLEEQYRDEEELILFDLKEISLLPNRIRALLGDDDRWEKIAERAYRRAAAEDTWKQRAELLLTYCDEIAEGGKE